MRVSAAALLVVVVVAAGVADAAPGLRGWLRLANDDPPSCVAIADEAGCEGRDDCSWCVNSVLGDLGCVTQELAKKIPAKLAECSGIAPAPSSDDDDDDQPAVNVVGRKKHRHDDKPKPKPPTSCGDNKEKHDCLHLGAEEGDCAWCEGGFMPASCMAAQAAKFLPEQVAKCKMPKKKKHGDEKKAVSELMQDGGGDDPAPKPKPPTSCGDNKEKRDCLRLGAEEGDCAWCAGDFMPASCVGVKAAEWIPEQVAKCKMPKKKKHEDDDNEDEDDEEALTTADELARKHRKKKKHDDDSGSGGGWIPGGGSGGWIPGGSGGGKKGGGGWIPGGGGDWGPGGSGGKGGAGGQGQGCMALKSRKKCLRGTDTEACAWCGSGSFLGSACVSQQTAQFIPTMISSCEMKKKKHSDREETEAVAVA